MILDREACTRARRFVETHGRPLENARLRFHLDGAPMDDVLAELASFQNADGGFGRTLEPDCRLPESSALATSIAFQILREVGVAKPNAMTSATLRYLLHTLDETLLTWRIVPPTASTVPQAPWWNDEARPERPRAFVLNPTAELLGYLYTYREQVPQAILSSLSDRVLAMVDGAETMIMHDLLCCKRLAETERLDPTIRNRLLPPLLRLLDKTVCRVPSQWPSYTLRPIQIAEGPQSPFFAALQDIIPQNLDYEIAAQQTNGSWAPNWSWGDLYPEAWEQARLEWAGVLVVEKLVALKRYSRIQGVPY
jgi:hypothetical protein